MSAYKIDIIIFSLNCNHVPIFLNIMSAFYQALLPYNTHTQDKMIWVCVDRLSTEGNNFNRTLCCGIHSGVESRGGYRIF